MPSDDAGDVVATDVLATDAAPRRLHPLTPFFDLILLGRQFALPLLVGLFANRDRGQLFFLGPVLAGTALAYVRWLRFTYVFDGRRFVISEGVLTRKERVIPLDRIQQVDMQTRLRHRLFGVTVLKIDTAGGTGGAEVDLSVVSTGEAARLRLLLLRAAPVPAPEDDRDVAADRPEDPPGVGQAHREDELVRLSVSRLMLAGVTGSELAVMLTIVGWFVQLVDDLPAGVLDISPDDVDTPTRLVEYVGLGLFLLVLWFGLAAAASVLRNGGYVLSRRDEDLHSARGVFDRREASIPAHRVQTVRVQETFVRRVLRMAAVRLRSTAGIVDVPLLTRREVAALLDVVVPGDRPRALVAAPPAARRRAIVRRVVPAAVVAVAVVVLVRPLAPVGLVLVVLATISGELAYRGLGHGFGGGFVVAREGGLRRETAIVPVGKTQSTRLRTTPLQRRAGLATLWIDVAGGGAMPAIRDGDASRLREVQAGLLSDAARQDELTVRRQVRREAPEPAAAG